MSLGFLMKTSHRVGPSQSPCHLGRRRAEILSELVIYAVMGLTRMADGTPIVFAEPRELHWMRFTAAVCTRL